MKKAIISALAFVLISLGCTVADAGVKNHALAKVGKALGTVASAPVVHPKRTFKQVVGGVVFAVEAGNDVVYLGLTALDKGASMELKHNPFHYAAVVDGKIDAGLEYSEQYFLGSQ